MGVNHRSPHWTRHGWSRGEDGAYRHSDFGTVDHLDGPWWTVTVLGLVKVVRGRDAAMRRGRELFERYRRRVA